MINKRGLQSLVRPASGLRDDAATPAFPFGLAREGVHEIAEAAYGDAGAAAGFALSALKTARPGIWLWIRERALVMDQGRVTGLGAAAFGLDPARFVFVDVGSSMEALMATEEGIRSGAVSTVITEARSASFTATRRLIMASEAGGTPALLLLPHNRQGATAAHARWRISPAPSTPNLFDARAPGSPRWTARLERCRTAPGQAGRQFDLEFDDETLCLRLVSGLVDGPAAARPARPADILPFRKAG
ncbi:ImuA family protein [Hyphobacterium sp.]|uniref:ImuA family protein n=1 Tax=Hyphobacterium sp. TaxID=2004662 RepID=UPI003747F63B